MSTMLPGARTSTVWSKNDPVMRKNQRTDHWSKMKHKATTFTVKMPEARVIAKQIPQNTQQFRVTEDGSIIPLRGSAFEHKVERSFSEERPGSYQRSRPRRRVSVPNMQQYRNPFNDRAREGFQYWPMTRPRPTLYGKYGMGCYKSVLGLGDAVRT
ncbi:uncharacterized protein LOC120328752 [Styela clava]|uniref:uncharacterized protein LOC120328752 n=1 Tax=Styela clava TaxID=7725 RepID=UPI001939E618|nr:uncharacterized protein LOC120328752 [Styela clava]